MLGQNLAVVRSWQKPVATARVWAVCHACNHGWLKDLEDAVMPTLSVLARLGTTIVPAGSQRLLALWAMKTSAVAQELNPNNLKPIGVGACAYLRLAQRPPAGATAWLLPSTEPDMDAVCWIATFGVGPKEVGYTAQVLAGRVRLAVIGPIGTRELPLQPSGVLGLAAIPIWPAGPSLLAL
jgi:hypothetical protein